MSVVRCDMCGELHDHGELRAGETADHQWCHACYNAMDVLMKYNGMSSVNAAEQGTQLARLHEWLEHEYGDRVSIHLAAIVLVTIKRQHEM